jgi:hypothetical protein
VFQHFPSKDYGLDVLAVACEIMKPGGLGYIQIRYDDGNPKYAPKNVADYGRQHLFATSYALSEFWSALDDAGLQPLKIANLNTAVNYAAFYFKKK